MPLARAAARAMMPRLVNYGWDSSKIIKWLGGHGATYRRITMLADIRQFRDMADFSPRTVSYNVAKLFPKSMMGEADLTRQLRYHVYGTGRYTNIETGAVSYRRLSFYDDTRRSKADWGNEFTHQKLESDSDPLYVVDNITISYVEHNKGLDY